ncbi:MAG: NUDIX hydrolase [Mangrovicoccus sp.]|nr:NUDIX hydrolase [Mangrovicoccus sp.]
MTHAAPNPPIRDAATLILHRPGQSGGPPEVLMGQRGAGAAFMPDKFVFPGGALSPEDEQVPLAGLPNRLCQERLIAENAGPSATAIMAAAIRELWEETGLMLGQKGDWPIAPPGEWASFAHAGYRPDASGLRFMFRAVTPPGRPRRFDARFFVVEGHHASGEIGGDGELSNLQWIPLDQLRQFNLPFITQVVLAELPGLLTHSEPPERLPYFHAQDEEVLFQNLQGKSPLDRF